MPGSPFPESGARVRALYALACLVLVSLPFLVVRIPPITDLAQQMAQIPLALEVLAGEAPEYRIQWISPNKLSYPLLAIAWAVLEPFGAATLAMILMAAVWIGACAWVAAKRNRPVEGAVLATVFFFNQSNYMGFFNFAVGAAAFIFWVHVVGGPEGEDDRDKRRIVVSALVGSLALYYSHVLWFGMGCAWLGLHWLARRPSRKTLVATIAGIAPTALLALTWYPTLVDQGWTRAGIEYGAMPWERLVMEIWVFMWLGGIHGPLEPLTLLALLAWFLVALWQHRERLSEVVDRRLLLAGAMLVVAAMVLPRKVQMTLLFAYRWMPVGAIFLVLALPRPKLRPVVGRVLALLLVATFTLTTAWTWIGYERQELAGLHESLERIPDGSRLLGLDFVRASPRIKPPVYFQYHAYSQLLHGGRLGFSFVELASSLVVKRNMRLPYPWTRALEWQPRFVRVSDMDHFDYVLVHGSRSTQEVLVETDPRLEPVTEPSRWRLFKIERDAE